MTCDGISEEKIPLLMEIIFQGNRQFFELNSYELSAYPDEQEILLQDGIKYQVEEVKYFEGPFDE